MASSHDIQRIFLSIPGLFLVLRPDRDFTIVGASADYYAATGKDATIVGQPVFEVFPDNPDYRDTSSAGNVRASLERVLSTRAADDMGVHRYDVPLPGAGGFEERYWSTINSPVLDDAGEVDFIIHRIEPATAKSNRNATEILESITEGFFTLDRQWRFDYVNPEAHRILGVQSGALTGRVLWAVYPGLEGTDFERNYRRSMVDREKSSFTAFYPMHEAWYEVTNFPAPEGISVYFRDVTQQKKLQADRDALAEESQRQRMLYEAALDNTPDFVYMLDMQHRFLYANAALTAVWGGRDARGKHWSELGYEPWEVELHDREQDEVVATKRPIRGEIPYVGPDGRRVYDYIFAPILDAAGEVVAVAGTTRDVTERQAHERALLEQSNRLADADRAKDEFLATLAHELRNPLAPLRNATELLRLGEVDDRTRAIHAMMERQIVHLIRLVDDLLEVSRISRGAFSLQRQRLALADVVRNAIETSEPLVRGAGHALQVQASAEPLEVEGDPVRLVQVLSNLLNNAATYADRPGSITVRVRRDGDRALVGVRDEGIGIAADALPRLFEMFNRGDRHGARNQGGLGIGLALSRRLAQMHGGSLRVESAGLGQGSEFTLCLPLAKALRGADQVSLAGSAPARARADAHAGLAGLRVLVVDDNRDAADSLALLLHLMAVDVRVVHGGREALDEVARWQPAVLLLDIGMPGMNGYEVAHAIRAREQGPPTLLIALTGWGQDEDRVRSREAGFDHHLVKPVELNVLKQMLEEGVD